MNNKVLIIGNHPIAADLTRQYCQRGDEVVTLKSGQTLDKTDVASYKEFALLSDWDANPFEADDKVMDILQQIAGNVPSPENGKRPLCHLLLRSHSLLHMIRLDGFRKEIEDKLEVNAFTMEDQWSQMIAMGLDREPITRQSVKTVHLVIFGMSEIAEQVAINAAHVLYEVQIRTHDMDEVAERGIASHWSYKEKGKKLQNSMEQKLQLFRNIMELNDDKVSPEDFVNQVKNELLGDNIYVYTPKGDVFELPKGSTPIDFAYKVHTKVGDTMVGALVNDMIVPLSSELKDGDIVKINTNKTSSPSKEWLNYAKTSQAKNKIKAFFSKADKNESREADGE